MINLFRKIKKIEKKFKRRKPALVRYKSIRFIEMKNMLILREGKCIGRVLCTISSTFNCSLNEKINRSMPKDTEKMDDMILKFFKTLNSFQIKHND